MKLNNKKGMEMALQTIVLLIILIKTYGDNRRTKIVKTVTDIGKGAIDSVIE